MYRLAYDTRATGEGWPPGGDPRKLTLLEGSPRGPLFPILCPSTRLRHDYEIHAWNRLQYWDPLWRKVLAINDKGQYARTQLNKGISDRPTTSPAPRGAFEAHHIIPIRDNPDTADARLVISGAFRCLLFPNSGRNGVLLRGYSASEKRLPNPNIFSRLETEDQQRQYHLSTRGRYLVPYFRELREKFVPDGIGYPLGTCDNRRAFDNSLESVQGQLKRGVFLPKAWEMNAN